MRLLIVDDEPIIRKGLAKMAERYPVPFTAVATASNGLDALDHIRKQAPDIMFTDIRMPKMDGLELCRQIHECYDHIQVVVISGYGDFHYAQQCMSFGVRHYLLKPVSQTDVDEVLDKLRRERHKGYVSVSRYEAWIEQGEQAIWELKLDEVERLTQEWKEYCLSAEMSLQQLQELLDECVEMLVKRLSRKFTVSVPAKKQTSPKTKEEVFAIFGGQLDEIVAGLVTKRSGNFRDPMKEAKSYIDSHLSKDITLEEVAERVGLTPTYFSCLFKKVTNETFVQYRIKKRMERAQQLLAVPHMRIVDVAAEVGYEDYPHFTKTFKKMMGYSPSEYRTMLGIK